MARWSAGVGIYFPQTPSLAVSITPGLSDSLLPRAFVVWYRSVLIPLPVDIVAHLVFASGDSKRARKYACLIFRVAH